MVATRLHLAYAILLSTAAFGQASETLRMQPVVFKPELDFRLSARCHLGVRHAGECVAIEIPLANETDEKIKLALKPGRFTTALEQSTLVIAPKGKRSLKVKFTVPEQNNGSKLSETHPLVISTDNRSLVVSCVFTYQNYLQFSKPQFLIEADTDMPSDWLHRWSMPLSFSEPFELDNLKLTSSKSLERVSARLQPAGGGAIVQLSFKSTDVPLLGINGELTVQDLASKRTTNCFVEIKRGDGWEFYPRGLVLVWDESQEAYRGTGVLSIKAKSESDTDRTEVSVEAPADLRVTAENTPMHETGNIQRVWITATPEMLPPARAFVNLVFKVGEQECVYRCPLVFIK